MFWTWSGCSLVCIVFIRMPSKCFVSALVLCLLLGWTGAIFDSPAGSGTFRHEPAIAPFYSRESLLGFNLPNLPPPDTGFDFNFSDIKKKSRKKRGSRGGVKNRLKKSGYRPPTSINNSFKCALH